MKRQKHRMLSTAVFATALSLGIAAASWAASEESSRNPAPNIPQIFQNMVEDVHMGWRGHRGHRGMRGPLPFSARPLVSIALKNHEELQLTDDQMKRLKDVRDSFSKKSVKERAEIQARRIDLRRALDAEKVDLVDVEKKIREISKMRVDLRIARLKAIQEGKSVLSDEQQKQLSKIARKHRGRGHGIEHPMFRGRGSGNQPQAY